MLRSVVDAFLEAAKQNPNKKLFSWVEKSSKETKSFTTQQLASEANLIANYLLECGLKRGDRALLIYLPSLDVIPALVGCLLVGVVPVPLPPTNLNKLDVDLENLHNFIKSCSPTAILSHSEFIQAKKLANLKNFFNFSIKWPDIRWIATDGLKPSKNLQIPRIPVDVDDVAFLQYTSGSTSFPKGVMITHGNLVHQFELLRKYLHFDQFVIVAWVPYYHDYCLICAILNVLYGNGCCYLMSPLDFLANPCSWFDLVTKVRATHIAAPNFGYELMVSKSTPEVRKLWDLSSLKLVQNASEPVRVAQWKTFINTFSNECNLNPQVCQSSFGLAEHTVGVAVDGRNVIYLTRESLEQGTVQITENEDPKHSIGLVSCGNNFKGEVDVRIINTKTLTQCEDLVVGEIWVNSPSKALGYYGLVKESKGTFEAEIPNVAGRYLRTGDLGFIYKGELYITGRKKDLIIVRGRNVYPHDIENSIRSSVSSIRPGGITVFSIDNDDKLIAVVEVKDIKSANIQKIAKDIFRVIAKNHTISCYAVSVVGPGSIKKTTSGKLKRHATRDEYVKGNIPRGFILSELGEEIQLRGRCNTLDKRYIPTDQETIRVYRSLTSFFARRSAASKSREVHGVGITASGILEIIPNSLPKSPLFNYPGKYHLLVRHANGIATDDVVDDIRGATLRIIDYENQQNLDESLMDLLLTTGPRFMVNSASLLLKWMTASPTEKYEIVKTHPEIGNATWEVLKPAVRYQDYYYYSKVAYLWRSMDQDVGYVKFRLVPGSKSDDVLSVSPNDAWATDRTRNASDVRSKDYLKDLYASQVESQDGINYILQAQFYPIENVTNKHEILDCLKVWPEDIAPWQDIGKIHVDKIVPKESIDPLAFSALNSCPEISIPIAETADETASLGASRALVYHLSAMMRTGVPIPEELSDWITPPRAQEKKLRICVIGAGVSGLTAAYELERLGHDVTVYEKSNRIAGKCGSFNVDGKAYDVGGHFCSDVCTNIKEYVQEFQLETEKTTKSCTYDIDSKSITFPSIDVAKYNSEYLRYQKLTENMGPMMHTHGQLLSSPVSEWFQKNDLKTIELLISESYTSSGYGQFSDPNLSALYIWKFLSMGILETAIPDMWTIKGGYLKLWQSVASKLKDIRLNSSVKVTRTSNGVTVENGEKIEKFDKIFIATPLNQSSTYLDTSESEQEIFSKILHYDYYTIAAKVTKLPKMGLYMIKKYCNDTPREMSLGHCVAFHNRYEEEDVYTFYSYADPAMTERDVIDILQQDIVDLGGNLVEICKVFKWDYFPHFSPIDLEKGIYKDLINLQGKNNTFYLGSIFNFELVECNMAFTKDLIQNYFGGKAAAQNIKRKNTITGYSHTKNAEDLQQLSEDKLLELIKETIALELAVDSTKITPNTEMTQLGLDSLRAIQLATALSKQFSFQFAPSVLFEHPTIFQFTHYFYKELNKSRTSSSQLSYRITENYIYNEIFGSAFLLDIYEPTGSRNGFAVIDVVSSRWVSDKSITLNHTMHGVWNAYCAKGFTVFAVRVGSFHRWSLVDMMDNLKACVRYIRANADKYQVSSEHIGAMGISAGGHLALQLGLQTAETSSYIDALTIFCPVCKLDNLPEEHLRNLFHTNIELKKLATEYSPLRYVKSTEKYPASLFFHAINDPVLPIEDCQQVVEVLKEGGNIADLIEIKSDQHEWADMRNSMEQAADWMLKALTDIQSGSMRKHIQSPQAPTPTSEITPIEWAIDFRSKYAGHTKVGGTLNIFDLSYIVVLTDHDSPSRPLFSEGVKLLIDYIHNDTFPQAIDPQHNLLMPLVSTKALITLFKKGCELVNEETIKLGVSKIVAHLGANKIPHQHCYLGRTAFCGTVSREAQIFLNIGREYLDLNQFNQLSSYCTAFPVDETYVLNRLANRRFVIFGEYLPDDFYRKDEVRDCVHSIWPASMPGETTAFLARYFGVTRDEYALNLLKELMKHPADGIESYQPISQLLGLSPHHHTPEKAFWLYFLLQSTLPVKEIFKEEVEYILRVGHKGLSIMGYQGTHPDVDTDMCAIANVVFAKLGVSPPVSLQQFNDWWSEEGLCYDFVGTPVYVPEHTMNVLEAICLDPNVSRSDKLKVWTRSVKGVRNIESEFGVAHHSIFYCWRSIISTFFTFSEDFPGNHIDLHYQALQYMLKFQHPNGGFCHPPYKSPNVEETAFALLALKSALKSRDPYLCNHKHELQLSATKAEQFIRNHWDRHKEYGVEAWKGRLPHISGALSESVILSSLY